MHNAQITQEDIANELGLTKAYVSMMLNGSRKPKGAREMLESAFESVKKQKGQNETRPES